jgi:hypothetical protein
MVRAARIEECFLIGGTARGEQWHMSNRCEHQILRRPARCGNGKRRPMLFPARDKPALTTDF